MLRNLGKNLYAYENIAYHVHANTMTCVVGYDSSEETQPFNYLVLAHVTRLSYSKHTPKLQVNSKVYTEMSSY